MKTKSTSGQIKKLPPQRTCVACHRVYAKRGLVRLVRTSDKLIKIDVTGRLSGRGTYLCRNKECWEIGIQGGKVEQSLKMTIDTEGRALIFRQGQDLIEEKSVG
jgi:uncharacterized protein